MSACADAAIAPAWASRAMRLALVDLPRRGKVGGCCDLGSVVPRRAETRSRFGMARLVTLPAAPRPRPRGVAISACRRELWNPCAPTDFSCASPVFHEGIRLVGVKR
jgi:hypothetical protein